MDDGAVEVEGQASGLAWLLLLVMVLMELVTLLEALLSGRACLSERKERLHRRLMGRDSQCGQAGRAWTDVTLAA